MASVNTKSLQGLRSHTPSRLRRLARIYENSGWKWRYSDNLLPVLMYKFAHLELGAEQNRVLTELNKTGVSITSVSELLENNGWWDELKTSVNYLEDLLVNEIDSARGNSHLVATNKSFIFPLLSDCPILDPDSIFVRFPLQETILNIVNAYFGMYTKLRFYNVWHTFKTQGEPRRSQLWHRDPEDRYIIKVFVYLTDVDDGAGPFTYAAGSHPKGLLSKEAEYFFEPNRSAKRSNDTQLAAVIPPDRWIKASGPAGTIVFADTRGYHKGGHARETDRVVYNCMFTSNASRVREVFRRPEAPAGPTSRVQAFALSL